MDDTQSFYVPVGPGQFDSTEATTSPWDPTQQHGGPPSALLARAVQACGHRDDMAVGRISIDFLGAIPQGRMTVDAEIIRSGRRIELVEARLTANDRLVALARAWRSQVAQGSVPVEPTTASTALPEPQEQRYFRSSPADWGYGRANEWRFVKGSLVDTGPATVWVRPRIPLVLGEETSGLQLTLIIADSTNGVSAELDLDEWLFIPPSLTLTVFRDPIDDWLLLDARTYLDARGSGMAHATLSDRAGQFGVATQPLLVQRRPS